MKDPEAQHPFHPRCATPNTLSKIPISSESHAAGVKVKVLFVSRCIRQLTIEAAGSTFTAAAKITVNNTNTANVKMTGQRQSPVSVAVKRESVVYIVLCYYLLFFAISGINSQTTKEKKKPETVQDLFNTSSCIPRPYRCPHRQIQFYLYTRRTQKTGELLDTTREESLYNTRFNRMYPTKIVVHGFGGGRNLAPSTDMRDAYFHRGNYNIIIVDYGTLVREPCLKQMEWAPRFCAKCIAQLVNYLTHHPRGVRADDLHLIGYSVGAHISGLVANYLDPVEHGKLGRITGLDPTIVFYMGQNRSRDLDYTDAHFVDVLHTGAGILGQWGPTGHADFYINGGSSQPGCGSDTVFKTLACDHTKVTPYFIESIVTKKGFWAYPCPTLLSFMTGWCSPGDEEYVMMGEHVDINKARGVYYVSTNPKPPYAQGPPKRQRRRGIFFNRLQ